MDGETLLEAYDRALREHREWLYIEHANDVLQQLRLELGLIQEIPRSPVMYASLEVYEHFAALAAGNAIMEDQDGR